MFRQKIKLSKMLIQFLINFFLCCAQAKVFLQLQKLLFAAKNNYAQLNISYSQNTLN